MENVKHTKQLSVKVHTLLKPVKLLILLKAFMSPQKTWSIMMAWFVLSLRSWIMTASPCKWAFATPRLRAVYLMKTRKISSTHWWPSPRYSQEKRISFTVQTCFTLLITYLDTTHWSRHSMAAMFSMPSKYTFSWTRSNCMMELQVLAQLLNNSHI